MVWVIGGVEDSGLGHGLVLEPDLATCVYNMSSHGRFLVALVATVARRTQKPRRLVLQRGLPGGG